MSAAPPPRRRLTAFERGCLAVVALAFLVRLGFILHPTVIWDSAWYLLLARSFAETGTFYLPWSEPGAPQYNGYWPPLFPILLSPLVKLLGPSYQTLVLGSVLASALLTAAVFLTTRDLFGRTPAFAAMALVAANPAFYVSDSKGMSESLLAVAVVLTVWAFLKSLDRPAWLPVAAAFAALAYLGKASLGLPFVLAGVLALGAWRVWRRGWRRVLTSPFDVGLALVAFAAFLWLARARSGKVGSVGLGLIEPLQRAVGGAECSQIARSLYVPAETAAAFTTTGPACWALLYPFKVLFVVVFLLVVTFPFSLKLREAIRASRTERTDALWLAVVLPLLAGAVFTTSFFFTERRQLVDFDNIRYLTPAMAPFLWLVLPHWDLRETPEVAEGKQVRRTHFRWYGAAVGGMFLLMLLNPIAGRATLPRLWWFLIWSLVPIGIGLVAYGSQYEIVERRVRDGVVRRYVPAVARRPAVGVLVGALALLAVSAWLFSAWYVTIGVGLLVAMLSMSSKARVLGTALMLLGSAAPGGEARLPLERALEEGLAPLPPGTVVHVSEQIVFPAAIRPEHVEMRLFAPPDVPPEADVLLTQQRFARQEYEGFTRVGAWEHVFDLSPTLTLRLAIEEHVLGRGVEFQNAVGMSLYVRNGTSYAALYNGS